MTFIKTEKQAELYLDQFTLAENQFIIGNQQNGITIYKQQVRSLNIFYSLYLLKKITKETRVAVIGGGIAGITFCSACIRSNINTTLFEKEDGLLPIQSKCKGRIIHPLIYDWPLENFTHPESDLPLLNWTAGNTNEFCNTIKNQFSEIKADASNWYEEILNCGDVLNISQSPEKWFSIETGNQGKRFADIIIYAVGYGLEVSPDDSTPIYWRDLGLDQANVKNEKYLISGTGDGALMDLFTLKIRDFSYDDITNHFTAKDEDGFLIRQLQGFRSWFHRNPNTNSATFMWDRFNSLNPDFYSHVIAELNLTDTEVVLHSRSPLSHVFNLDKISMFNGFLLFILSKKLGGNPAFKFVEGELIYDGKKSSYIKGSSEVFTNYVHYFRWGTDRKMVLKKVPTLLENFDTRKLLEKQKANTLDGMVNKKWPEGSLQKIFRKSHVDEIKKVSANALPILEHYTTTIYEFLKGTFARKTGNFRVAVHKVVYRESEMSLFQQITPYAGSQKITFKGGYSRIKSSSIGSVGYSIRTGKPSLITRTDKESENSFKEYLKFFGLKDVYNKVKKRKSFLTMPILALNFSHEENKATHRITGIPCLVLYIDSDQNDFFDTKAFEIVITTTKSFIMAFESCLDKEQFLMDDVDPEQFKLDSLSVDREIEKGVFFRRDDRSFKKFVQRWEDERDMLNFKDFHSFTLEKDK